MGDSVENGFEPGIVGTEAFGGDAEAEPVALAGFLGHCFDESIGAHPVDRDAPTIG